MSRLKGIKLENEVDRNRGECNWKGIQELLPQIKMRGSGLENLFNFIYGEWLLESYIESLGSFPTPDPSHRERLQKAGEYLNAVFNENEDIKPHVALETHLLQAKMFYLCADYEEAIKSVQKARLDSNNIQFQTLRTLRLVAEAYSIKGLSLEKQSLTSPSASRGQKSLREEQILGCFEKSADLSLSYIQELEKASQNANVAGNGMVSITVGSGNAAYTANSTSSGSTNNNTNANGSNEKVGELMDLAIQRVPFMYIQQGHQSSDPQSKQSFLEQGIEQYRKILTSSDKAVAGGLHQKLSRQLSEVLLRGVPGGIYQGPSQSPAGAEKTKHLSFYVEGPVFCPQSRLEELLLILSISEGMAARESVLSRAEEDEEARRSSHLAVKAAQNLLTLVLSSLRQYQFLAGVLEKAMKFAFQDKYVWFQFALALISFNRYSRAAKVLKESLSVEANDSDPTPYLFASMIAIEHLSDINQGRYYGEKALELCQGGWLCGRAQLLIAMSISLQAQSTPDYKQRKQLIREAISAFDTAVKYDPKDYLSEFFLALQLGIARDTDQAKLHCLKSIDLNWEQPAGYMLLGLLLSTSGELDEALSVVEEALNDHPNHYGLLVLRLKLEMALNKSDDALMTAKELLLFWKSESLASSSTAANGATITSTMAAGAGGGMGSSKKGGMNSNNPPPVPPSASSLLVSAAYSGVPRSQSGVDVTDGESIMGGTTGGSLSEYGGVASTVSDSLGLSGARSVLQQWRTQANIWLELAEMFLDSGRMDEVAVCVEEATTLFPNSHHTLYLKGRILLLKAGIDGSNEVENRKRSELISEGKGCFLGALAIFPNHIPSLRRLAITYQLEGNLRMAEKIFKDLVKLEPMDEESWRGLGSVLGEMERGSEGSQCFATATLLHSSAPILPYSVIPRTIHL